MSTGSRNISDSVFIRNVVSPVKNYSFDPEMLKVFYAIDGTKSVQAVAESLGLKVDDIRSTLIRLCQQGLVLSVGKNHGELISPSSSEDFCFTSPPGGIQVENDTTFTSDDVTVDFQVVDDSDLSDGSSGKGRKKSEVSQSSENPSDQDPKSTHFPESAGQVRKLFEPSISFIEELKKNPVEILTHSKMIEDPFKKSSTSSSAKTSDDSLPSLSSLDEELQKLSAIDEDSFQDETASTDEDSSSISLDDEMLGIDSMNSDSEDVQQGDDDQAESLDLDSLEKDFAEDKDDTGSGKDETESFEDEQVFAEDQPEENEVSEPLQEEEPATEDVQEDQSFDLGSLGGDLEDDTMGEEKDVEGFSLDEEFLNRETGEEDTEPETQEKEGLKEGLTEEGPGDEQSLDLTSLEADIQEDGNVPAEDTNDSAQEQSFTGEDFEGDFTKEETTGEDTGEEQSFDLSSLGSDVADETIDEESPAREDDDISSLDEELLHLSSLDDDLSDDYPEKSGTGEPEKKSLDTELLHLSSLDDDLEEQAEEVPEQRSDVSGKKETPAGLELKDDTFSADIFPAGETVKKTADDKLLEEMLSEQGKIESTIQTPSEAQKTAVSEEKTVKSKKRMDLFSKSKDSAKKPSKKMPDLFSKSAQSEQKKTIPGHVFPDNSKSNGAKKNDTFSSDPWTRKPRLEQEDIASAGFTKSGGAKGAFGINPEASKKSENRSTGNSESVEYFENGLAALQRKAYDEALLQFQKASELDPENRVYKANIQRIKKKLDSDSGSF